YDHRQIAAHRRRYARPVRSRGRCEQRGRGAVANQGRGRAGARLRRRLVAGRSTRAAPALARRWDRGAGNDAAGADVREVLGAPGRRHAARHRDPPGKKTDGRRRERIVRTLRIARACHWRYEWVETLPADVYAVLVEELIAEQQAHDRARTRHGD